MKKYDYVIVGGGLFAGTFAYFAKKQENPVWLWKKGRRSAAIFTVKTWKESMYTSTAPIFSYEQQKSMGFREFSCGVQPLHKLPGGKL